MSGTPTDPPRRRNVDVRLNKAEVAPALKTAGVKDSHRARAEFLGITVAMAFRAWGKADDKYGEPVGAQVIHAVQTKLKVPYKRAFVEMGPPAADEVAA